jgi:hypothetical protein
MAPERRPVAIDVLTTYGRTASEFEQFLEKYYFFRGPHSQKRRPIDARSSGVRLAAFEDVRSFGGRKLHQPNEPQMCDRKSTAWRWAI